MKKIIFALTILLSSSISLVAQTMNVVVGNVTYQFPAASVGDMTYTGGNTLTALGKVFSTSEITSMYVDASEVTDNSVSVTYNGTSVAVKVAGNIAKYITPTVSGAHVSLVQSDDVDATVGEITYSLTGTSSDGEFYLTGSYKSTIELNGVTLTNATPVYSGAAVFVNNSKRINVKVITGTTNTLVDAASGSQKGALYVKGHAEFKQNGTLNVTGKVKHAIKAGEYITIKNATINVLGAASGDGINCTQFFQMESGSLTISGQSDDGVQVDLDGDSSTGVTTDHEGEDTGNLYLEGGTVTITVTGAGSKGLKVDGDIVQSGATVNITSSATGTWDTDDSEVKASDCLNADGNITVSGGSITTKSTGGGGRGIKCEGTFTVTDGTISVTTTGGTYYATSSTTGNTNWTGSTDNTDSKYYAAAKGIKAGDKDTSTGGIVISGGTISVTTSGRNAEGIESKNTINISGGDVTVNSYDDGINSTQDLTISGGYVYSHATNNDGIDANGNLYIKGGVIFAIGSSSPELALDANTEENKKLYVSGGTLFTIGGLESGASLTQNCYSTSSWSKNTWYALTVGSDTYAFKTPSSGGSTLVVSGASKPTLKSGVTVSSGTEILSGNAMLNATVSGGSSVTLSSYTGSNSGGGPGGGPGGGF